jgi:hypothetical protein
MQELIRHNMVSGLKLTGTASDAQCEVCIQAKQHIEPFPKQAQQ